jgi:hypothetical protein
MEQIRIVAIPTKVVELVRTTMLAPGYGFPAHSELGADPVPCRYCLRLIRSGVDRRILFTYVRFAGVESLPLPGPVFIHAVACERYPENVGFPMNLVPVGARLRVTLAADVFWRRNMSRTEKWKESSRKSSPVPMRTIST